MTSQDLSIIDSASIEQHRQQPFSVDQCVTAWIAKKFSNSNSEKTRRAYTDCITMFRKLLQDRGYDLDSDKQIVSLAADVWCNKSASPEKTVSAGTYNQKRAILSSFYKYAILKNVLADNPMTLVEGRKAVVKDAASYLPPDVAQSFLDSIDRKTLQGLRDYALLTLALTTGRRASELASLTWKDISIERKRMVITWAACKGDKQMEDVIAPGTQKALLAYLSKLHGNELMRLDSNQPIFVSFSRQNKGKQISIQTVSNICKEHLHTSKVHTTRHSFAVAMELADAKLSDIGARLGHSNLKTTSDYMKRLHSSENKYASAVEKLFGIS